ncbi:hypothetical protein KIL84_005001 [Mauremys mutica]|uniref:Large ribosomal subunit protein uL29m n=1 Tax=Mauremys mutica TaxID=74926 RepID=A0A9D4B5Q3_9SAUR|nr:hypothetical protein KIL84_005001 [Mauremys mutica]
MLLTLEQEAKRQSLPMPSPERLEKVEKSMGRINLVIKEREVALRLLQTGHENPRPGEWRNDFLGCTYWYNSKEWPIPWYLNKKYNRRKFYLHSIFPCICTDQFWEGTLGKGVIQKKARRCVWEPANQRQRLAAWVEQRA